MSPYTKQRQPQSSKIRHMPNSESAIAYEGTETIHEQVVGREFTGSSKA